MKRILFGAASVLSPAHLSAKKSLFIFLLLLACLPLLIITCKKNEAKIPLGRAIIVTDGVDKDLEFVRFKSTKDSAAMYRKWLTRVAKQGTLGGQAHSLTCAADAWTTSFGVTRTGSCAGGYSYSLRLDDIIFYSGTEAPTTPAITINGYSFNPIYDSYSFPEWHYHLTVPYTSIGLSNASYCSTSSLDIGYWTCGTEETETDVFTMDASEACGQTGTGVNSTATPYSYIPFGSGHTGGANLSILWSLCGSCAVNFPDGYTFQYRVHGTSSWTNLNLSNPDYLSYNISLASGTYDLQGLDGCGSLNSLIWVTGPTVPAPGAGTFVVP